MVQRSTEKRPVAGKVAIPHDGKTPVSVALNVIISKANGTYRYQG